RREVHRRRARAAQVRTASAVALLRREIGERGLSLGGVDRLAHAPERRLDALQVRLEGDRDETRETRPRENEEAPRLALGVHVGEELIRRMARPRAALEIRELPQVVEGHPLLHLEERAETTGAGDRAVVARERETSIQLPRDEERPVLVVDLDAALPLGDAERRVAARADLHERRDRGVLGGGPAGEPRERVAVV